MSPTISLRLFLLLSTLFSPVSALAQAVDPGIRLLEPIGNTRSIPTVGNEGLGVFGYYFNTLYPWVIGMAAAIAVLNGVWGGIDIIQAGGDSAAVTAGKNKLLLSMAGLLIILASAIILTTLNPSFYK